MSPRRIADLSVYPIGLGAMPLSDRAMLAEREVGLELSDAARDALAAEGYDPHFGARPLKRTIQRRLQNPLAMKLLSGEFKPGATVAVDAPNGEIVLRAVTAAGR